MTKVAAIFFLTWCLVLSNNVMAQELSPGTTNVVLPAQGEVRQANDKAVLTLLVEEQDKDKAAAASRVNLKMKQGMETVRHEDASAQLKTRGYYTYPIYPDQVASNGSRNRQAVAWRVGQYLDISTEKLDGLPKMVAATQRTLAVSSLNFGLSDTTLKSLDERRITAAFQHLKERIASVAKAMGRPIGDATIVSVDLDGAGDEGPRPVAAMMRQSTIGAADAQGAVEEPSFEPGETTLQMRLIAKVHFK